MNKLLLTAFLGVLLPMKALAQSPNGLDVLDCVTPEPASYWASGGKKEIIVAFSAEGLFEDIQKRLPPEIFAAAKTASRNAMAGNEVRPLALNVGALVPDFYRNLEIELAKLGKKPDGACGLQVQDLIEALDRDYVLRKSVEYSDSWLSQSGVSELSGKIHEIFALVSMAESGKSSCRIAFNEKTSVLHVCK